MRLLDHDEPIDPEIAAALDAIDATLAGEPVDPQYAETAEIALLLSADRPALRPEFARSMDERMARRFAPAPVAVSRRRRWWRAEFWEATAALAAAVGLIVAIVVMTGGGHGGASVSSSRTAASGAAAGGAPSRTARVPSPSAGRGVARSRSSTSSAAKAQAATIPPTGAGGPSSSSPTLQPPTTGRKVVQSAQLALASAPSRIDDVAQQVYDVIGALGGVVENSSVTQTGGPGGYADFQLSVPSASLGQAMSRLSSLNYAQVVSRTDASQDITDQYGAAQRELADARALRTSLLKQLSSATTTEQVDSLKAQIHDAEASISSDQATLNRLGHQVGFSQLSVEINGRSAPAPVSHGSGAFGIGQAARDAGRVLTVAAGVALIAIAALLPVVLIAALAWWVGSTVRRRRREHALDVA